MKILSNKLVDPDVVIADLRAEVQRLRDECVVQSNEASKAQHEAAAIKKHSAKPDCRCCTNLEYCQDSIQVGCINGNKFENWDVKPLWRTE